MPGNLMIQATRQRPYLIAPALQKLPAGWEKVAEAGYDARIGTLLPYLAQANHGIITSIPGTPDFSIKRPLKVGVLFSGGPAAGGHNVVAGLFDNLINGFHPESQVYGFKMGPAGLLKSNYVSLTPEMIAKVRNTGGFDLLGTSRTKLETEQDFQNCQAVLHELDLDGLVVVGGDDSNTNAAFLANFLLANGLKTRVVGVPKTIDGDLMFRPYLSVPFGFHTAARTYAEMVGNICADAASAKKIWHFIKLMGRSASHLTLEVALQTHPDVTLIGEEIREQNKSLAAVVEDICQVIRARYGENLKYGVVLIPEGIVEFIPEIRGLISKINGAIAKINTSKKFTEMTFEQKKEALLVELDEANEKLFVSFPAEVQQGLLADLDPHDNVQVSKIPSEALLIQLVKEKLKEEGIKIDTQPHFFGYEGRSGYPTIFDANYCYNLGLAAASLIAFGHTGYMAALNYLDRPASKWSPLGIPLIAMMGMEKRKGQDAAVIKKGLVEMSDRAFQELVKNRALWALNGAWADDYQFPGPIQFWGPPELTDDRPLTLLLNSNV